MFVFKNTINLNSLFSKNRTLQVVFLKLFLILTILILSNLCFAASTAPKKPNFVLILVDDLGWKDLGCYGSKFYETPNIDQLCRESMKFTDAYAASPVSSPTRASIMTGKYPARTDITEWSVGPQPNTAHSTWIRHRTLLPAPSQGFLELEEVTIAEALKEAGYKTLIAGKWHLGKSEEHWPEHQGFDINKGGWGRGKPNKPGGYFVPYGNPRLEDGPEGEYLTQRLAKETVKFINESVDEPFFVYLSFYSVHGPFMASEELEQKYLAKKVSMNIEDPIFTEEGGRKIRLIQNHATYAGMVEEVDSAVGEVLSTLKELSLQDDTIVILTSDNGGRSYITSNQPLRRGKGWIYEGGIREPLIIKWPATTKAASTCAEPVISNDFYPTILEMAGLKTRPEQHIDGKSLVPLLKGKKMDRGPLYWHYPHYGGNESGSPASAIRDGDWKLIEFYEPLLLGKEGSIELYNLNKDISEKRNLAKKEVKIAKKLYEKLKAWRKEVDAKHPSLNPLRRSEMKKKSSRSRYRKPSKPLKKQKESTD